jgi:hypothetical protein
MGERGVGQPPGPINVAEARDADQLVVRLMASNGDREIAHRRLIGGSMPRSSAAYVLALHLAARAAA